MGKDVLVGAGDVAISEPRQTDDSLSNESDSTTQVTERGNWGHKLDFLLSCVGYAVGLGNLWRFPYLCMRNGGGAFLIPYFTFLFLCGIPLFLMELSLGQYASLSPMSMWKICPLFKGIGYGMVLVSGIVCIYYNLILAWALYYMGMSFTKDQLPWMTCGNEWNTKNCRERSRRPDVNWTSLGVGNATGAYGGASFIADGGLRAGVDDLLGKVNLTLNATGNGTEVKTNTPAEEFWHFNVLEMTEGIEHLGGIRWQLLLCLVGAWLLVFFCLCRGIKTSGKVVYVTAVAPYVMLFIFLGRGLSLPGAMLGVKYYLTPDWERLLDFQVWNEACAQIFYSLGPAYGSLITMASYNKFNSDCYKDALVIPCINCGTSFLAGFAIFSIIGFMASEANVPVKDVITSGPGLAFVVYPEAMTKLPISQFWAIIFFLMLLILGLDTQFGMFETMTSGFIDEFPKYLSKRKTLFTAVMCMTQFLIGLPLVTRGGIYLFTIIDWYSATFSLITIGFLECVVISWIYGADRLYGNLEQMIGYRPCVWWKICWKFITPSLLFIVLIITIARFNQVTYGDYTYPSWAVLIGWVFAIVSLIPIPVLMVRNLILAEGSFIERLKSQLQPTADWGPVLPTKIGMIPQMQELIPTPTKEQSPELTDANDMQKVALVSQPDGSGDVDASQVESIRL